jgi:hypothetical protein
VVILEEDLNALDEVAPAAPRPFHRPRDLRRADVGAGAHVGNSRHSTSIVYYFLVTTISSSPLTVSFDHESDLSPPLHYPGRPARPSSVVCLLSPIHSYNISHPFLIYFPI